MLYAFTTTTKKKSIQPFQNNENAISITPLQNAINLWQYEKLQKKKRFKRVFFFCFGFVFCPQGQKYRRNTLMQKKVERLKTSIVLCLWPKDLLLFLLIYRESKAFLQCPIELRNNAGKSYRETVRIMALRDLSSLIIWLYCVRVHAKRPESLYL